MIMTVSANGNIFKYESCLESTLLQIKFSHNLERFPFAVVIPKLNIFKK